MPAASQFNYVIYIRTTAAKLWDALRDPAMTRQYWCETWQDCEWKPGAPWRLMIPDGRVGDAGEIIEIERTNGSFSHGEMSLFLRCTKKVSRVHLRAGAA